MTLPVDGKSELSAVGGVDNDTASIDTREQDLTIDPNDNNELNTGNGLHTGEKPLAPMMGAVPTAIVVVETKPETNGVSPPTPPPSAPKPINGFVIPKEADVIPPPPPPAPKPNNAFVIPKEADVIPPELQVPEPEFPPPPEIVYANAGTESKTDDTSRVIGEREENPYADVLLEATV